MIFRQPRFPDKECSGKWEREDKRNDKGCGLPSVCSAKCEAEVEEDKRNEDEKTADEV